MRICGQVAKIVSVNLLNVGGQSTGMMGERVGSKSRDPASRITLSGHGGEFTQPRARSVYVLGTVILTLNLAAFFRGLVPILHLSYFCLFHSCLTDLYLSSFYEEGCTSDAIEGMICNLCNYD